MLEEVGITHAQGFLLAEPSEGWLAAITGTRADVPRTAARLKVVPSDS